MAGLTDPCQLHARPRPVQSPQGRVQLAPSFISGQRLRHCAATRKCAFSNAGVIRAAAEEGERFRLNNLSPHPGSKHRKKRVGRGHGAGQGGSAGRGMRGQKSRSGGGVRPGFEGGQMPLYRRLPKLRGIAGGMGAGLPKFNAVNLDDLAAFQDDEVVTIEALEEKRILNLSGRQAGLPLKVLGTGSLPVKLEIKAASFSKSALAKIEEAGGKAEVIPQRPKFTRAIARARTRERNAAAAEGKKLQLRVPRKQKKAANAGLD